MINIIHRRLLSSDICLRNDAATVLRGVLALGAIFERRGQTAEELHASDYETYAYLQTGQDKAAGHIVRSLPEMASRFDPKAVLSGAGPPSAIPARYALERRDWQQAEQLFVRC